VADNQQEYYRAIRRSTRHNDSGIFAAFMLAAIKQATAEFKVKYNRGEIQPESNTNEDVNEDVNAGVKLTEISIQNGKMKIICKSKCPNTLVFEKIIIWFNKKDSDYDVFWRSGALPLRQN
jgi:hypothetical protein